jgi:hypothetical protein
VKVKKKKAQVVHVAESRSAAVHAYLISTILGTRIGQLLSLFRVTANVAQALDPDPLAHAPCEGHFYLWVPTEISVTLC